MSGADDDELFYRPKRHKSDNEQPSFLPPHVTTATSSTSQYTPPTPLDSIQVGNQNWNVGQDFQNNASTSSSAPEKRNYNGETLYDRLNALAIPFTRKPKKKNPNTNGGDGNVNQQKGENHNNFNNYDQQHNSTYPHPSIATQPSYHNVENWDNDPNIPLEPPPVIEYTQAKITRERREEAKRKKKKDHDPSHAYQPPIIPPLMSPNNEYQPPLPPLPPNEHQPPPPPPPLIPPHEYQSPIPPLMSPHEYSPHINHIPPLMPPRDFQQKQQQQHTQHSDYSRREVKGTAIPKMNMNLWKMQNNIDPKAPIPASCSLCMKNFESRKLIRLHLKSVHGINRDQENYIKFIDEFASNSYETNSTCSNNSNSSSGAGGGGGKIIVCRFWNCGQQCMDFNELRDHYEMCHRNASNFFCLAPFCKTQFTNLRDLDLHFNKIHPNATDYLDNSKSSFQCQKNNCHRSFPTLDILKNHRQLVHKTSSPYYCHSDKNCNANFHQRDKLDVHIRDFHPQAYSEYEDEMGNGMVNSDMIVNPNFSNNNNRDMILNPKFNNNMNRNINNSSNNNNNMTREENWEDPNFKSGEFIINNDPPPPSDETDFTCHFRPCLEKFPTSDLLSYHLCRAHGAKFKCGACHRQCTSEIGVLSHFNAKHVDLNTLPSKFTIIIPPRSTNQQKNKNNNITYNKKSTISPLLPNMDTFPCQDPKCPSLFRSLIHMKNHYQLKHKSKGRFNCCSDKSCVAYFYTGVELELHLKTVHPNEYPIDISKSSSCFEIKCDVEDCNYISKTEEEAEDHQRLHRGDSLDYKCEKEGCGVSFIKKQILQRHMRIIHKENNQASNKEKMHQNQVSAPVSVPSPEKFQQQQQHSSPDKFQQQQQNSSPVKLQQQYSSPEKFQQQYSSPEKYHQQYSSPIKFQHQNSISEPMSIVSPTSKSNQVVVVVKQENEEIHDDSYRDSPESPETLTTEIKEDIKEELSEEEEGEVRDEEIDQEEKKEVRDENIDQEEKKEVRDENIDQEEKKEEVRDEEIDQEEKKEIKGEVENSEQHIMEIDDTNINDNAVANDNNNTDANINVNTDTNDNNNTSNN